MNENEKIELFDKWYDENYDEWAEGEEGIALREELEQAFKGGIAELEKKNAELKAKIYGGGYEAVITKKDADITLLEHSLKEQKELHKSVCDQLTNTHRNLGSQLTKAKEIIKNLMVFAEMDDREYEKEYKEAEQFLSEVEK